MLRNLSRLPHTAGELREMADIFGAKPDALHLAQANTETAIRTSDLSHVRVLAFATHGLTASEGGGGEPGLVFTPPARARTEDDGLLTASEAATLHLDADWVILSACNTAAGMEGSSGLTGLARAFFFAGARSILASYWPVRDDVAAELTTLAVKLQRANPGMLRSEALREAMRRIRQDPRADRINDAGLNQTWAQPNAWAPFMLVGVGED
jgi:CHAT domain-containing protein